MAAGCSTSGPRLFARPRPMSRAFSTATTRTKGGEGMHGRRHHGGGCHKGRFPDAETLLRRLEEYQRDLEQETADVADLIRRLKEDKVEPTTAWAPLTDRDPVGRPVRDGGRADEVRPRHRAPVARVARGGPVVAHHEVLVFLQLRPAAAAVVAAGCGHILVRERPAVDEDDAVSLGDSLAGEADHPLDEGERAALATGGGAGRSVEHGDLAPTGVAEAVDDPE